MYKTDEALRKTGLSRPTFIRRVKALGIEPKHRDDYGTKTWSEQQLQAIVEIQATCKWCASPYHTRCYIADSTHADIHAQRVQNRGIEIVDWTQRKEQARKV